MNALPVFVLFGIALGWLLLPLLPALRELLRPKDVEPLKVVDRAAGDVAFFARNFRDYIARQMGGLPAEAQKGDFFGRLPDGTHFLRVHKQSDAVEREAHRDEQRLVVVDTDLTLRGREAFLMEVYARAPLTGGPQAVYRALYAERALTLGIESVILRWVHAAGVLTVGDGSLLRGRVSSDAAVVLGTGTTFERIAAPAISVGPARRAAPAPIVELPLSPLPEGARRIGDHLRIEGNFKVSSGTRIASSLVVAGRLVIQSGAIVEGSVKAHREIEVGREARVHGAVVTRTRASVGPDAWVAGPLIAEDEIRVGRGAVVGAPDHPTTVSAPVLALDQGATVYGQINAPAGGRTAGTRQESPA